jgi:surface protein
MFQGASAFNQPIGSWNMEEVVNASAMFTNASSFNQDIDLWLTTELVNTNQMFQGASSFNTTIENWNVMSVTTMESMFQNATAFDQPLNLWNVQSVTSTQSMFEDASAFNQNISSWILLSLTDAESMFQNATSFHQILSEWGGLPDVNLTNFSLSSNAILGSGPPDWITRINDNTSGLDVDDITKVRESIAAVSEGVPFMSGPRYGYISIDDHQTNSKSEFQVVYADSVRDDNIIARINLAPRSIHTLSLRDAGMASLLNRTRTYQGPVNIQKLTIKLYDEYGRIIDLNNTDWSFTLEFEKEVKELVGSENS